MEIGITTGVLHAINAASSTIAAGAVSHPAAAAASSAGAVMYANLELGNCSSPTLQENLKLDHPGLNSPAGISSLRRASVSEISTAPVTPRGDDVDSSGVLTPGSNRSFAYSCSLSPSMLGMHLSDPETTHQVVDVKSIVERLQAIPLTGQVVAWAWERAAQLSFSKRAPPVSLLAALWRATDSTASRCTAQDVVEMMDAWIVLLERWPRYFALSAETLTLFTSITIPAAIKRMNNDRLQHLVRICTSIARHRSDPSLALIDRGRRRVQSARDLMQPIFALVVAEAAWRTADQVRYVSDDLMEEIISSSTAWRWSPVPNHDSEALVCIKQSTKAGLDILSEILEKKQ